MTEFKVFKLRSNSEDYVELEKLLNENWTVLRVDRQEFSGDKNNCGFARLVYILQKNTNQ